MSRLPLTARRFLEFTTCLIAAAIVLSANACRSDDARAPRPEPVGDSPAFDGFDFDHDGVLTLEEFVKSRPRDEWRAAGALFHRSDINADERLSLDEFREKGTRLRPDAVIERVEKLLRDIELAAAAADSDHDGHLTAREWSEGKVSQKAGELRELPFSFWDRDEDGVVTPVERRALVEIAFGICRTDGQLLRKPAGIVVDWGYMRYLDKDHDDIVSREEFTAGHFEGAKNAERFLERDTDGDGRLTFAELAAAGVFLDVYSVFCKFDANLDGRVTGDEALSQAGWWEQTAARRLLPAFDLDGDGALTVDEFELCPFGCPFADWYASRNDADNDGRLSWTEYYVEQSPVLYGISRFFYGRFDRDGDGLLSRSEFDFQMNLEKVPDEVVLAELDRNSDGRVTMRDIVDRNPRPPASDRTGVFWWEERTMRQENAFMAADDNHDGAVTPEEFSKHRAIVVAGILDKPLPRTPAASKVEAATLLPAEVSAGPFGTWKTAGLIAGNVVLLAGAAWMIRRRA